MFQSLTERLKLVFDQIRGRGLLSESDVNEIARDIRIALLEADVSLPVVKELINQIKEKAVGQEVLQSIQPAQQIIKIVHDHLCEVLGSDTAELNLNAPSPIVIMMVGLQGSGKTTTTAKIAKFLAKKHRKKVLMASLDIYRPAAQEQLAILGQENDITTLEIIPKQQPLDIATRALRTAKLAGYDVLIIDTAGRLHVDEPMMDELVQVQKAVSPTEIMLVTDAMTGQDAVNIATVFQEKLAITGIALTRVDGDARGGAALSMSQVTKCPIKFLGQGEHIDQLEVFHPQRIAGRILGMGDVVSLVEQTLEKIDQKQAEKLSAKMMKGQFNLNDMLQQLQQMNKMGGIESVMKMLPGAQQLQQKMPKGISHDKTINRQIAIIQSMTIAERKNDQMLNASRRLRIAKGAGTTVQEINKLIKQFKQMQQLMKKMKKFSGSGFMKNGIKGLFS